MKNAECLVTCFSSSGYKFYLFILLVLVIVSIIGYFTSKNGISKVKYYWLLNVFLILSTVVLYLSMSCDMLWFLKIYIMYVGFVTLFLLGMPVAYRGYISGKYGVERFEGKEHLLRKWSNSAKARLYIFGSAVPKALTIGKDVFISAGMVDLLTVEELNAVIAHEAFHVNQNRYIFLNNFKILTFMVFSGTKFEVLADLFAEEVVGERYVKSAKMKVRNFYLS